MGRKFKLNDMYKSFERYLRLYEQEQIIANEEDVCRSPTSRSNLLSKAEAHYDNT